MQITKNIWAHELFCHCGNCNVRIQDHEPIIQVVQGACDHFADVYGVNKVRLEMTSPARCYVYNRLPVSDGGPGSNDESQHPRCSAMDIKIFIGDEQVCPDLVAGYFEITYPYKYGIGRYNTFTHIDTREIKARWGIGI